jgi:hypothetical protein
MVRGQFRHSGYVEDGVLTATPLVHRGLSLLQLFDQRLDPLLGQRVKSLLGEFAVSRYLLRKLLAFFAHETWLTAFGLGGSTTHSLSPMDAASRSMMTITYQLSSVPDITNFDPRRSRNGIYPPVPSPSRWLVGPRPKTP